jgi:AbrB family looped-hinge helix DNA binding protein
MGEVVEMGSKRRIVIPSSIRNKFALREASQPVVDIRDDSSKLEGTC